ncbi:hydantoinase B/oxoprolinase family protein [Lacicoccus alkaliphilus]|uniref:N-methylhydantoinase B n=1 Tax=Lacicoccus alkaliphilus DSM 16010 TaxID=1123231 RepID=A0A1M7JX80_9BACL|nr:hydantoinase B/oxoprolinase family protein [Salinicoccus alkaliphilus]SHM57680.1 N-methylhydantoinase B [Salinicoccus alkaliphilus DSM 16010]
MISTFIENPITTEIIRNALSSAAEEMNESLARSSFSPIIYEMKDCSVGIYNENAELLGQSSGLPTFLGNLDVCIRETTKIIGGNENYSPGDVYIMNDSYLAGTHLNDITVIAPIFYKDDLVGFSATRAHWLDLGAKDPGYPMDATEIYQEGLRIPPLKIYNNGEPIQDIIKLITMNSRLSDQALGDLNAQIAACNTGNKRVNDIVERHGIETFRNSIKDIFRQSELIDIQQISVIPDGVYTAEGTLDNDGVTEEEVPVKVKVTIENERLTIDLEGSSPQRMGMTNCGLAQTVSACRVAFKHMIGPDSPVTGGNFKTMDIKVPKRSIFSAEEPAACGWYFTALGLLIDLIIKALSPVLKEESAAAHYGDSMVVTFSGRNEDESTFLYVEPTAGGWGAFSADDGQSGLINNSNGDFKNLPVEVLESKYPLKINEYGFRVNSGGAGRTQGGQGIVREYELTKPSNLSLWFERAKTPAWGLFDGLAGKAPEVEIITKNDKEKRLKVNSKGLYVGDRVIVQTGGGGGFGPPLERNEEEIRNDILDGLIDEDFAREKYGYSF